MAPSPSAEKAIREWLLADADFNVWFLETTKGSLDDATLMALLGDYGDDQDAVEHAWKAFLVDHDDATLIRELGQSMRAMTTLKHK